MKTNRIDTIDRRAALRIVAALATLGAGGLAASARAAVASAQAAAAGIEGAAFDAAVAGNPWLRPFKGIDDSDPAQGDRACPALALSGRWPAGLRGRFYRNGPALFERGGQRYHHWFDGDGMVQKFAFDGRSVAHTGKLVRTSKLVAEREAKRFIYSAFGTGIASEVPLQGPDSLNVANTSVIEHAGRLLAMWEGGSAYALDPADLSTSGPVTWQAGLEQVPFSAHPKRDPQTGDLWNIGTFGDRIVVWHIGADGRLARVQTRLSPYPNGMVHDVAVTARHIVLPLPPVRMDFGVVGRGGPLEQAFRFDRDEPLRVLVMEKADIAKARLFELPSRFVFHVANAHETRDGQIELSFAAAADHGFLVHGAVELAAGRPAPQHGARLHQARLDLATGKASLSEDGGAMEFPCVDPRRVGAAARRVVSVASWKAQPAARAGLFHGVSVTDLSTGRVDRHDYGSDAVVEEHIVVPKPPGRGSGERDAWLVGTVFDARRQVTTVNLIDAAHVADGPIASAALPYALPLGFHGTWTAA